MSALVWEEPPGPKGAGSTLYGPALAELRSNPGAWARIAGPMKRNSAYNAAGNIKRGNASGSRPAGSFDAVARTIDGEVYLFARYVGGEK